MDYRQRVRQEAQIAGLDPNIAEAVLMRESAGNPNAVSPAGAQGLMQLMPGTAKELGVDPRDPVQNIQGGVRYLKKQIDQYGVPAGIAAYNAGPGRVAKVGGNFNALPAETRAYVPAVMNTAANLAQGGGRVNQEPNIGQVMSALERARAANDTEAINEISGMLQTKFTAARQKAQAAGDTAAVAEIDAQLGQFGAKAPMAPKPAPAAAPQQPQAAPQSEAKKEEPKSWMRTADDFVRGVADTLTFGYADEIAAKMDQLTGGGQSGKKTYDEALAAQRQRDAEGGGARIAGQVTGAVLPGAGVVGAIRAPANATRLGRTAAGAGTGAVQGALYGSGSAEGDRLEGALTGGAIGAATGGVLGGLMPATAGQVATKFQKKAGDPASAAIDAEIIRDLNVIAKNEANRGNPVQAIQANNLEQKYVTDATRAIKQLGKDGLKKTGLTTDDIQAAVQNRRILSAEELDKLRGNAAGDALADAIDKAQRTRSMTAPVNASTNPIARTGRALLDLAPLPQAVRYAGQRILGARNTREDQIQKLIGNKEAQAADILAGRVGPSAATQSLEKLQGQVTTAQRAADARAQLMAQQRAQAAAQNEANRIGVLQDTRVPLGGGFQELLQGGRSNLNLQSKEAIDALRLAKRRFGADSPIGKAADQTLKSQPVKDENAFYGLQNWLRKTQESGALAGGPQPGALSGVNPVRNPIAYQANVDNAMGALKNAADNAPNKALAQFARKVAGTKSIADKEKMIADRMGKASPEEAAFLEQFVSPLTQFGKKQ
jgi:Transglycosylase SLT domain